MHQRFRSPIGRSELLTIARELKADYGDSLSLAAFQRASGVPTRLIEEHFGSWSNLRKVLRLPDRPAGPVKGPSRRELITKLRQMATGNEQITLQTFAKRVGVSQSLIYLRFRSWRDLRVQAGLPANVLVGETYSEADILGDLLQVCLRNKRCPPYHKYKLWGGKIAPQTIARRFGGWRAVRIRCEILKREYLQQVASGANEFQFATRAEIVELSRQAKTRLKTPMRS